MRSLGGKLIFVTALTLLFCMLLFTLLSGSLLKFYSEHDAKVDAQKYLPMLKREYQFNTDLLIHDLKAQESKPNVASVASLSGSSLARIHIQELLAKVSSSYHLSTLAIISTNHKPVVQFSGVDSPTSSISSDLFTLVNAALQGREVTALQRLPFNDAITSA